MKNVCMMFILLFPPTYLEICGHIMVKVSLRIKIRYKHFLYFLNFFWQFYCYCCLHHVLGKNTCSHFEFVCQSNKIHKQYNDILNEIRVITRWGKKKLEHCVISCWMNKLLENGLKPFHEKRRKLKKIWQNFRKNTNIN